MSNIDGQTDAMHHGIISKQKKEKFKL